MLKVFAFLQNLPIRRDDRGITAVEYVLLLVGIGVLVAAAAIFFGGRIQAAFNTFSADL
jgi:Flp pilus assembly pilin Flp